MKPQSTKVMAASAALMMFLGACQRPQTETDAGTGTGAATAAMTTSVIPRPAQVEPRSGQFLLTGKTPLRVSAGDGEATRIARDFAARLRQARGFEPQVGTGESDGAVNFLIDPKAPLASDEAYTLDITDRGATITARAPVGLFYGAVTLWQLATADGGQGDARIAAQRIEDAPRFVWRGLMLDVARHFRSVDEVKALLDQMALHKLNTFHWHLTDDQGWRIQIRQYPKLTEVGGCRIPAGAAGRDADGKPKPYCGYYTQDEIRDVVQYAAQRFITVVPEIDLPGHAQAAIAAYPQLGVTGQAPPVSPDWGINTWLFNVDDGTFTFLENVLGEVMELFPSRYIHLGGDEAAKDQWQKSPAVQAKLRELNLKDEMQLQSWFMGRLGTFIESKGRRLIGWDEILEGGPPADATVMSWRGTQGAIDAARAGHDVVLSPAPDLYFDHIQSDAADETPGRLDVISLKDVYGYQVVPVQLSAEQAKHVLGAQANLWTEHMRTNDRVQRALFPRAAALAENTWTPAPRHDWNDFLQRMPADMARYRAAGFHAADSAFAVRFAAQTAADGRGTVTLSNQSGFGQIRYTTDGSEPSPTSSAYAQPLAVSLPATIKANAFVDGKPLAATRSFAVDAKNLRTRGSHALRSCKKGLTLRLEDDAPANGKPDGDRAILLTDVFDPCWVYDGAELDGIGTLEVRVGQLPHNFQLWKDAKLVVTRPATVPGGALEVRLDGCEGKPVATLPLAPARRSDGLSTLQATLPALSGRHDLCFTFASGGYNPMWAIDEVTLLPGR
ncbi:hexosaminidase [Lysobacter niastensis]|uniref:beta-N-acetylhexosaminidase n=1 Tax=Lysobacter niastensis TaxID=380629 RepID=A0ABU1WDS5_9GAMM|nr:family 20 glycosylhydrolase [Lysobacter niastensis]MDR7135697.1 hexosaminidase [Lysobacter niastensis]